MPAPASRLTSYPRPLQPAPGKTGDVRFRQVAGRWLVTGDAGAHAQLDAADFEAYIEGRLEKDGPVWTELKDKGLIGDHLDFQALARDYRTRHPFLFRGPALHILVTTLRCNHKCVYCHASVVDPKRLDFDMTPDTARRAVDFAFQTPGPDLVLEFQGGEPLLNWPVVEFVVRYARKRNEHEGKNLFLALVTNFSLMDRNKLEFLVSNKVAVCTSLDGPADLHDGSRIYLGGASHAETVRWIAETARACEDRVEDGRRMRHYRVGALFTTTRQALGRPKDIVDEYVRLGLEEVFLRPLSPIGFARRSWSKIGYTPGEFLRFYREALDYIVERNLDGTRIAERWATLLLRKILRGQDPGFVDLRSPGGAGLGVLAYDYDGTIYNGDEGRMLGQERDPMFRLGDVRTSSYRDVIEHPTNRACAVATTLDGQPLCSQCAYKPYCGACPVINYAAQGTVWGRMPDNFRCETYMGVFDLLFERLREHRVRRVMESWLDRTFEEAA